MYELSAMLAEITGMKAVSLQPAAGAHGELTGVMIIKAYHEHRGDSKRTKMIVQIQLTEQIQRPLPLQVLMWLS